VVAVRKAHTYSPQTLEAVSVMGLEIARARRARRWTQEELSERAGISDSTLRSIEHGSTTATVGTVFEVATLLGIDLFGAGREELSALIAQGRDRLALLPARVRARPGQVEDDF
jgi:transcriptional regulator with XRE-family HTH domain